MGFPDLQKLSRGLSETKQLIKHTVDLSQFMPHFQKMSVWMRNKANINTNHNGVLISTR